MEEGEEEAWNTRQPGGLSETLGVEVGAPEYCSDAKPATRARRYGR